MPQGIIGLGIWCVDTTYKIHRLPERGKLEPIIESFQCVGGGPSNVLTDLNALGFKYPMIAMGSIGADANASFIKKHCQKHQIQTQFLIVSKSVPTSHVVCMYEKQKERTFLYFAGANNLLDTHHFKLNKLKNRPKILYVGYITLLGKLDQFSNKRTRLQIILKQAKKNNIITVVDLASNKDPQFQKIVFSSLPYIDYLLLNEIEAQLLFKESIINSKKNLNKKKLIGLSKKIFKKGILKALIIHSPDESLYISLNESIHTKSKKIAKSKIVNSVGAGDAFCAGFIYGIYENWNMKTTLLKAHAAGAAMMKVDASSGKLPNIKKL
jgi:sugar/nucleoside kinase (ribokinase family)